MRPMAMLVAKAGTKMRPVEPADAAPALVKFDGDDGAGQRAENGAAHFGDAGEVEVQRAEAIGADGGADNKGGEVARRNQALRVDRGAA